MPSPRITAVIVTRNNRRDIADALTSLRESTLQPHEVIVVDQSSTDQTADLVRRDFPDVVVLDFWDNPGFGEGNNRGMRVATGEYLFLLNPDAMVDRGCLGDLVAALEHEPSRGIAVPKTVLTGEPSVLNSAGLLMNQIGYAWDRGYLEWDASQFDRSEDVLAGSGCALLIRTDVANELRGFDPSYFLYYEDLDLCLRSWLAGHAVHYVPAAVVKHNMKIHARPLYYGEYLDHRNRLLTLGKTFSAGSLGRVAPALLTFEAKGFLDMVRRRQWEALYLRLCALGWNAIHAPSTLQCRRGIQRTRKVPDSLLRKMMAEGNGVPSARAAIPSYPPAYEYLLDRGRLASRLEMGHDSGTLGLGWYGLESLHGRTCRWCCGYGILFLRAPADDWSGVVEIDCLSPRPLDVATRIGGLTDRFESKGGGWESHRVQAAARDGVIRVELVPESTLTPSLENPASPDRRVLGIATASVTAI